MMTRADECRLFTRYLLDCDPSPDLVARYEAAHALLDLGGDAPELRLVHRYPRLLGCLDAAAALVRPRSALRRKVYVTAALLETTPEHAEFFLQRPAPFWPLLAGLVWQGVRSMAKATVGVPLLLLARRLA